MVHIRDNEKNKNKCLSFLFSYYFSVVCHNTLTSVPGQVLQSPDIGVYYSFPGGALGSIGLPDLSVFIGSSGKALAASATGV